MSTQQILLNAKQTFLLYSNHDIKCSDTDLLKSDRPKISFVKSSIKQKFKYNINIIRIWQYIFNLGYTANIWKYITLL